MMATRAMAPPCPTANARRPWVQVLPWGVSITRLDAPVERDDLPGPDSASARGSACLAQVRLCRAQAVPQVKVRCSQRCPRAPLRAHRPSRVPGVTAEVVDSATLLVEESEAEAVEVSRRPPRRW